MPADPSRLRHPRASGRVRVVGYAQCLDICQVVGIGAEGTSPSPFVEDAA